MLPRRSWIAEPVVGDRTTLSGIDVLERLPDAQGCLPQAAHPVSHCQPLGEIDGRGVLQ